MNQKEMDEVRKDVEKKVDEMYDLIASQGKYTKADLIMFAMTVLVNAISEEPSLKDAMIEELNSVKSE